MARKIVMLMGLCLLVVFSAVPCFGQFNELKDGVFVCPCVCDTACAGLKDCVSSVCNCSCTGECSHDMCEVGDAMPAFCDPCVTSICSEDPYCCTVDWDDQCVDEVTSICGLPCVEPEP